ncbi:MAG: hypothetical protein Q4D60_05715 [Eubacteriales bacterium]|nr:hypothetical protein [Eubacteriales bacterium]
MQGKKDATRGGKMMAALCCLFAFLWLTPFSVSAQQAGDVVMGSWNRVAGTYNEQGQIVMNVCAEDYQTRSGVIAKGHVNSNALDALCDNDEQKTIVIPSGSTVELENVFHVGSNTKIIADGATLVMTQGGKGIVNNRPREVNYNSLENVWIQGGTWQGTSETESGSIIRLNHGKNVTIENATVMANYESHGIELIAMKDVTVQNCQLKVYGKKNKNSVEEALQIDVASPKTAPALVQFGKEYVEGQTCDNIKILNNTIEGSRGLCANFAGSEGKKYKNKYHGKITVIGNTMTGYSAEGCVIYNTENATVKNNVVRTYSTRKNKSYSVGLNITLQGKANKKRMKKSKVIVTGNKVYGVRQGIQLVSLSSSKYKKAIFKNNTCYASKKANGIMLSKTAASKIKNVKNKSFKR